MGQHINRQAPLAGTYWLGFAGVQVQQQPATVRGVPADTLAAVQVHQLLKQQQPITDHGSSLEDEEGIILPVDEVSREWELSHAEGTHLFSAALL